MKTLFCIRFYAYSFGNTAASNCLDPPILFTLAMPKKLHFVYYSSFLVVISQGRGKESTLCSLKCQSTDRRWEDD